MLANRSMPESPIIPVLAYDSVSEAVQWLCRAFGFTLRWRIGEHRAQLAVDATCAIAIVQGRSAAATADHVMIRVADVGSHRERALAAGVLVGPLGDHVFGERQYAAVDHAGRTWVFTETIADVDPQEWGAVTGGTVPRRGRAGQGRQRVAKAVRSAQGVVRSRVRERKTRS